jgi:BetI-type transcriptional repressor, C-terminal
MLYERVLERGAESGPFDLTADPQSIARALVALQDGLGLQVVLGHPSLDSAEAKRTLLATAGAATRATASV